MRRIFLILCTLVCKFLCAQITEQTTTPQTLPNLIPGFSQVSSINNETLSFTYFQQPDPPTPLDGDTTTERSGPFKYGESIDVSYTVGHGNITQTSEGKVWTLSIKMMGGAKNMGLTFDSLNLFTNSELYIYNESRTVLMGAVKTEHLRSYTKLTTGPCKESVIYVYIIEKGNGESEKR